MSEKETLVKTNNVSFPSDIISQYTIEEIATAALISLGKGSIQYEVEMKISTELEVDDKIYICTLIVDAKEK